jgi:hypothetical protein
MVIVVIDIDYFLHTAYLDITAASLFGSSIGSIHTTSMINRFANTRIIDLLVRLLATEMFVSRIYQINNLYGLNNCFKYVIFTLCSFPFGWICYCLRCWCCIHVHSFHKVWCTDTSNSLIALNQVLPFYFKQLSV